MKRLLTFPILLILVSAMAAQTETVTKDASGNLELRWKSGVFTQKGQNYTFDIRHPGKQVYAAVHREGIEFWADRIQGKATTTGKQTDLDTATATGRVKVVKNAKGERSEITGPSGKYTKRGTGALLTMSGPVTLRNFLSAKAQTLVATGSALQADVANATSNATVRTATLSGPVRIVATHRISSGATETITATGNRVTLNNMGRNRTVTLSGSVKIKGSGSGFGESSGLDRVVLILNTRGEAVQIETYAGGSQ